MGKKLDAKDVFYIDDDKSFKVKANLIRAYIPYELIDKHIAEFIGQTLETFGLFDYDVQMEPDGPFVRCHYKCPYIIRLEPSRITTERDEDKNPIYVLEFIQDDKFIVSIDLEQSWKVGNAFLKIITNGYMPNNIRYDEMMDLWRETDKLSGLDLKLSDSDKEIMLAQMTRNPNDLKELFRYHINKKADVSMKDKKMVRLTIIGKLDSTFSAVSGGDPKQGITMSINRERQGVEQNPSPVEEAIK